MQADNLLKQMDEFDAFLTSIPDGVPSLEIKAKCHLVHVAADGKNGHTAKDDWHNCTHLICESVR